jgi:hypothetical protein
VDSGLRRNGVIGEKLSSCRRKPASSRGIDPSLRQVGMEIAPIRIEVLNELKLPPPVPVLDLLFPNYGRLHGRMGLVPDELGNTVAFGE